MEPSIGNRHQQSIFDQELQQHQDTYKSEEDEEYVTNPYVENIDDEIIADADISQEDIEYLNSLDQKLSSKKLSVKTQSLMQGLISQHLSQDGLQDDDNLPTERNQIGMGNRSTNSNPISYQYHPQAVDFAIGETSPILVQNKTLSQQQTPWIENTNGTHQQNHYKQHMSPTSIASGMYTQQSLQQKLKWTKRDLAIEKLTRSNKEIYIEAARIYKQMEEKKECTFKPKVNQEGRRYTDVQDLFERLHDDRQRRQVNMIFREEQKARFEVQHCTFSPQTMVPKDPSLQKTRNFTKNQIYDKLYSDYDSLQRKKLRQQYEREEAIKEQLTFKPKLIVSQSYQSKGESGSNPSNNHQNNDQNNKSAKNRFEHLYQDYIRRQVEMQSKIHEANSQIIQPQAEKKRTHSISVSANKTVNTSVNRPQTASIYILDDSQDKIHNHNNQEKPRYLALYEQHKEKDKKQRDLFIKVNRDEGVTFQPKTFRSNSSIGTSSACSSVKNSAQKNKNNDLYSERGDNITKVKKGGKLPPRHK